MQAPDLSAINRCLVGYNSVIARIQAPVTTFSTFSEGVRLEGGPGNCCRLATLTGVHQGAHISPNFDSKLSSEPRRAEILRNILQEKLSGRGGSCCRFDHRFGKKKKIFVGNATQTGGQCILNLGKRVSIGC